MYSARLHDCTLVCVNHTGVSKTRNETKQNETRNGLELSWQHEILDCYTMTRGMSTLIIAIIIDNVLLCNLLKSFDALRAKPVVTNNADE